MVALLVALIADLQQITFSFWNVQLRLDVGQMGVHAFPKLSDLAQQRPAAIKHDNLSCVAKL